MAKWTSKQENFITQHAQRGAVWLAGEMEREFGIKRTPHAIKCRASALGLSLSRWEVCPRCGAIVRQVRQSTGYCDLCTARVNRDRALKQAAEIAANEQEIERELPQTQREWARYRQQKFRAAKNR